ncbi:MAG TPA: hypothetical protein ENK22_01010 [Persephonella sp.]|nr:hypothetical protein [Persephonella sp.]
MKFSQLVFGFLILYLSSLGLYASWTAQPKNFIGIAASIAFIWMGIIYIFKDLNNYSKHIKGDILQIDVEARNFVREILAFVVIGLGIYIFSKFWSGVALYGFSLLLVLTIIYVYRTPMPGIYKNGKYLGVVHVGSIRVSKGISLGKKKEVEYIGKVKIFKDGKEIAKLVLTAEGLMELKPEKLHEVFPEVKGKIEKFEGKPIFKIGDYTVEYDFTRGYITYQEESGSKTLDDCTLSPNYTFCAGNIHKHH